MTSYRFFRTLADGSHYTLSTAVSYDADALGSQAGWRFFPNVGNRRPSRKRHATMEKCLPRWLGYPDRCQSEEAQRPIETIEQRKDTR